MKTINGIELNLKESKYIAKYKGFTFFFSSQFYRNKYIQNLENYIEYETQKLINKYKIEIDLSIYFSFALYKRIEKRGFRVINKEGKEVEEKYIYKM